MAMLLYNFDCTICYFLLKKIFCEYILCIMVKVFDNFFLRTSNLVCPEDGEELTADKVRAFLCT